MLENIALQQNGCPVRPVVYELHAVSLHLGAECTANGHYLTYAKCADGHWYRFDDARVDAVNMDYELTTRTVRENTYLLFYKLAM